uniref:Apyrase n=1 Tax=Salix viminalis TaxID=40686 RepID=A0A6N2K449_SALVM
MEPKLPSKLKLSVMVFSHCKWGLKLCGVCLVILFLLLGVYFASNNAGEAVVKSGFYHYTVVVDCGSTGTRVNVYKCGNCKLSNWDLPILVHSYPDNSTQEQWVPRERHGDTPIFVLATAGLRRLLIEDARQVLDDVEDVVKEHSFVSKKSWIRPRLEKCKRTARAAAVNLSSLDWSQPADLNNCKTACLICDTLNFMAGTHPSRRFHALSGFFAVYNMLDLPPIANLTKIWEKAQQMCSKSWSDSSSTSRNQNIGKYCFRVPYMASLIEDALCLGDNEIVFGPGDLSWTLGASLVEVEKPWPSSVDATILSLKSKEVLYSSVLLFLLLLFISFIVYYSQIKLPMPGKKIPAVRLSLPSYIHPKLCPN